jgi:23S rRNA (guanine745-N1)-methyltransferase
MPLAAVPHLVCPFDTLPLTLRGASLACTNGHTFDFAREGYVNLLPVQDKASRDPGDSKEMVAARRRFLETGAYAPIAAALGDAVLAHLHRRVPTSGPVTILDAGCGEGAYLEQLAQRLTNAQRSEMIHLAGIDISKWAVRAAAKRAVPASWVVANNRRPPFAPESVDLIVCLFGFPIWEGFAVVQAAGGEVVLIDPGPDHLQELRALIYPEVMRNARPALTPQLGYRPVAETAVTARTHVATPQAIADLLAMTPHAHRAKTEGLARLAAVATLDVTIDVTVRTYQRM